MEFVSEVEEEVGDKLQVQALEYAPQRSEEEQVEQVGQVGVALVYSYGQVHYRSRLWFRLETL